jgi:hypothetical protein
MVGSGAFPFGKASPTTGRFPPGCVRQDKPDRSEPLSERLRQRLCSPTVCGCAFLLSERLRQRLVSRRVSAPATHRPGGNLQVVCVKTSSDPNHAESGGACVWVSDSRTPLSPDGDACDRRLGGAQASRQDSAPSRILDCGSFR